MTTVFENIYHGLGNEGGGSFSVLDVLSRQLVNTEASSLRLDGQNFESLLLV